MMDPLFGDFSEEEEYYDQGPPHGHGMGRPRRQLPQVHKQQCNTQNKLGLRSELSHG
jgi:hypothetical protein